MDGNPLVLPDSLIQDPHPLYDKMRAKAPVTEVLLPRGIKVWLVTGHDEARAVMTDARLSKDIRFGMMFTGRHLTPDAVRFAWSPELVQHNLLNLDPPRHTRLRRLVARSMTQPLLARVRAGLARSAERLLAGRPTAELVEDYAGPLAFTGIAELLGIAEPDRERLRRWSTTLLSFSPAEEVAEATAEVLAHFHAMMRERKAEPTGDMVSNLMHPKNEADVLTDGEIASLSALMIMAGHETTQQLIGMGALGLLDFPEQLAALREDPGLITGAVEELLRWVSPIVNTMPRYTTEDVEFGGVRIPRGEIVLVGLGAVNRDPGRRGCPHAVDISNPGPHLAFGHGIHYCTGASLARMAGHIGIGALVARYPGLVLDGPREELSWYETHLSYSLARLPVRLR
ncbi:cytochrome P450 [Crossiella equi]|uniref:Cytochrome P450 n=1 Tax=Crossiella equi TaxID=130796 RepID=A0ABS5ASC7_9PSEU|nr:cytochrome P450 [Crossiella equi]MBP2479461.1 cytochrome P450 [Crossiella equi]